MGTADKRVKGTRHVDAPLSCYQWSLSCFSRPSRPRGSQRRLLTPPGSQRLLHQIGAVVDIPVGRRRIQHPVHAPADERRQVRRALEVAVRRGGDPVAARGRGRRRGQAAGQRERPGRPGAPAASPGRAHRTGPAATPPAGRPGVQENGCASHGGNWASEVCAVRGIGLAEATSQRCSWPGSSRVASVLPSVEKASCTPTSHPPTLGPLSRSP